MAITDRGRATAASTDSATLSREAPRFAQNDLLSVGTHLAAHDAGVADRRFDDAGAQAVFYGLDSAQTGGYDLWLERSVA